MLLDHHIGASGRVELVRTVTWERGDDCLRLAMDFDNEVNYASRDV